MTYGFDIPHRKLNYSMRHVNPTTAKFDNVVEVAEVARFHAHEVSIVIIHNLSLTYIVPRSIGLGEACGCCSKRTQSFLIFVSWPGSSAAYCRHNPITVFG